METTTVLSSNAITIVTPDTTAYWDSTRGYANIELESPWIPIVSAPKDGTPILLLYTKANGTRHGRKGQFATQGYWRWKKIFSSEGRKVTWIESTEIGEWYDYTNRLIQMVPGNSKNNVTHWMPLPELPK